MFTGTCCVRSSLKDSYRLQLSWDRSLLHCSVQFSPAIDNIHSGSFVQSCDWPGPRNGESEGGQGRVSSWKKPSGSFFILVS